jgi:hypothetical protein
MKQTTCGRGGPYVSARCRAVRFDMRGVDHQHVRRSPAFGKRLEHIFPDPTVRPAHEAVIDCRRWTIGIGAITPHRQPLLSTCTISLMTRRSSARSLPRMSLSKCGSIRFHCSTAQTRHLGAGAVSSMKISRAGSRSSCPSNHASRRPSRRRVAVQRHAPFFF